MGFKDIELANTPEQVGKLEAVEIGFTSKCNFNCDYCGAYNRDDKDSIMSAEKVIDVLKDLPHLKRIRLSGGEVTLMFEDCLQIIDFCTARGIESQINTNGSVLNRNKIDELNNAGLKYLHFSLNHFNAQAHHKYYKMGEKTFDRIAENIKYTAFHSDIDAITETIIFEETMDHFDALYDFTYGLGVRKWQIQTPVRQSKWRALVPKEKIMNVVETILARKKTDSEFYFTCLEIDPSGEFYKKIENLLNQDGVFFPNCVEGVSQLHLHSNGEILICDIGNPVVVGNINKGDSLASILSEKSKEISVLSKQCECTTFI